MNSQLALPLAGERRAKTSVHSGYESAPTTLMLATHCVACGRALVDANSVEAGMGPDCRAKHGFDQDADEATRKEVNQLVYELALWRKKLPTAPTVEVAANHLQRIRALQFTRLADVLEERLCAVTIFHYDAKTLILECSFSEKLVTAAYALGLRWNRESKHWTFAAAVKGAVFKGLCSFFPDELGRGPKGVFALPRPSP